MKRRIKKENNTKEKQFIENVQNKNKKVNMAVFLTDTTLPMLEETRLIKLQKLPLE